MTASCSLFLLVIKNTKPTSHQHKKSSLVCTKDDLHLLLDTSQQQIYVNSLELRNIQFPILPILSISQCCILL